MAVSYGFYNSLNHDRRYDALQMSSIFDGIINDGVYMSIEDKLMVKATSGMIVTVGLGRAWFDHTWTLNDSLLSLEIPASEIILNRIDAVVLDINANNSIRANNIIVVKGTASSSPVNPTLINDEFHHQYPLAYIYVGQGVTNILQSNITNAVGTSECPFVTGIIETISTDELIIQWKAEWEEWSDAQKQAFADFYVEIEQELNTYENTIQKDWDDWFNNVKTYLGTVPIGDMQNQINAINDREFNRYYGIENKTTIINKNGLTTSSIVETADEWSATTTFSENNGIKTITTELVPNDGNWNYTKKAVITKLDSRIQIVESYTRSGK